MGKMKFLGWAVDSKNTMKLKIDLIKAILLEIEADDLYPAPIEFDIEGYESNDVAYHIVLMEEAGLIRGVDVAVLDDREFSVERMTWEGHAFLANSKDETRWERLKKAVATIGDVSFDAAKAGLAGMAHAAVATAIQSTLQ